MKRQLIGAWILGLVTGVAGVGLYASLPDSPIRTGALEADLRTNPRFAALSVYAEAPFDRDVFVYLAGDVRTREDHRAARAWVYAHGPRLLGREVVAVMDEMRTAWKGDPLRPDSFRIDRRPRPLTKYLMTPRRGTGDRAFFHKIGTPPDHIAEIERNVSMEQDLVALGPVQLALALQETYKQLTLYRMGVYGAEGLIARTQMMLEVRARMPPQKVLRDK